MIYYYHIRVIFYKGNQPICKDYYRDFLTIGQLFVYLETKHKDNYDLIFIKERRSYYGKNKI